MSEFLNCYDIITLRKLYFFIKSCQTRYVVDMQSTGLVLNFAKFPRQSTYGTCDGEYGDVLIQLVHLYLLFFYGWIWSMCIYLVKGYFKFAHRYFLLPLAQPLFYFVLKEFYSFSYDALTYTYNKSALDLLKFWLILVSSVFAIPLAVLVVVEFCRFWVIPCLDDFVMSMYNWYQFLYISFP